MFFCKKEYLVNRRRPWYNIYGITLAREEV